MFITKAYDYENNSHELELRNIAFLVGNGINRHNNCDYTWQKLLTETFPSYYREKFLPRFYNRENTIDTYLDGLSYPEMAQLAFGLRQKEENTTIKKMKDYKTEIASKTINNESSFSNSKHTELVTFAQKYNLPILTTNYDKCLLKTNLFDYEKFNFSHINWLHEIGVKKADSRFLTNAYFSNQKLSCSSEKEVCEHFAIWYIHGLAISPAYNESIRITNKDYAESIANLKSYLDKDLRPNNINWKGTFTWVNIIMHNDLIIVGLGLEQSEIDLRWLLVERYIYHTNNAKKAKEQGTTYRIPETIFVHSGDLKNGSKMFFDTLGIKFIQRDYDKVFNFDKYLFQNK